MRFTVVGPAYPLRGGIAHHVYWLRRELAARGHDVQVISFRKLYPTLFFPGTTEIDASGLKLEADALSILSPTDPRTWREAARAIKAFAPAAVIYEWWQPFFGMLAGTLARSCHRAGIKFIFECHNVFPHESTPVDRLLLKFAFGAGDWFIAHSAQDRENLLSITRSKRVSVSPLPSLYEFSSPAPPPRGGRRILFFGKVRKYKGLWVLLEAMPKVLDSLECELTVVGEFYDPVEKYREIIERLGIGRHVRIEDRYVPNEEVARVFSEADVLVLPYVSASSSGVAQIAFSNGLPVIASRAGGLSEAVAENVNGLLFPPRDSDALADQIINYFANNLGPIMAANLLASSCDSKCRIVEIIEEAASTDARSRTLPARP
jgi:D-inositol-3-phosphate glycosyltransferase